MLEEKAPILILILSFGTRMWKCNAKKNSEGLFTVQYISGIKLPSSNCETFKSSIY
jgi:hypothetical protein